MALFRSFNEIVNSVKERLRLTQPNLDTKPGTVARDLFIDPQAEQIEKLHQALLAVSDKQSPASASGADLDRWASNFGISRKNGSQSTGLAVYTISEFSADIPIPAGTIVTARNGTTYRTIGSYVMSVTEKNRYAATASRLKKLLNLAGITDRYALEVPVQAASTGRAGNISPYQIINANLDKELRVTNLTSFSNGDNAETDAAFRARIFATFSGANTGTSLGYKNAALSVSGVLDALVVEPGNTLMLRDGTETIQVNDGSFRILNSGTGGKVDIYILGTSLAEQVESYIYYDRSGNGDPTDDRNTYVPGVSFLDPTLTSEERRILAFKNGQLPLQPIDSIISITGSSSGVFTEKFIDSNNNVSGNFELVKDLNASTGGSPFGYDYIKFISGVKEVAGEVIIKQDLNSVDALKYTDIKNNNYVYQDRQILQENSKVSTADRSIIYLNHSPVVTVSRVTNSTTGEVYVITEQNLDPNTGLNELGQIKITGKNLPTSSDVLSVNYTWRQIFDKYLDYNGENTAQMFKDPEVVDSVDWGTSNGIFEEESLVGQTDDALEFQVETEYDISRIISIYSYTGTSSSVVNLTTLDGETSSGLELALTDPVIKNIISIKNNDGLEVWNTNNKDGSFENRTIYLPSDSPVVLGELLTIKYNRVEIYNIENSDGNFSNNLVTLPSTDALSSAGIYDLVNDLFLTDSPVYIQYVAAISLILPTIPLTSLPVTGTETIDRLLAADLTNISLSNQPIFYKFVNNEKSEIVRFGPTKLSCEISGSIRNGKLKVSGTTLTRLTLDLVASVSVSGKTVSIKNEVLEYFNLKDLPNNIGIARIDKVFALDESKNYDIVGYEISNNEFDLTYSSVNQNLNSLTFILPNTSNNNSIALTSGSTVRVECLIYYKNDFEDLYFNGDQRIITNKTFARIDRVSVFSGFRNSVNALVGSLKISAANQPDTGSSYASNYSFSAPKEGERISIRYNTNILIGNVTSSVESVRSITADVLVKEAFSLDVDVEGEILINEDAEESQTQILENVNNAVTNLLNTGTLGGTIDYSDVISAATSVVGVDSVNVSLFNESGNPGRKSFIKALDNQTISAGSVNFVAISRKDFKIT